MKPRHSKLRSPLKALMGGARVEVDKDGNQWIVDGPGETA